jgi:hypothetical protein
VIKIPDVNNLKEEGLILVHGFRGVSPCLLGPLCWGRTSWQWECVGKELLHLIVDRKKRESGKERERESQEGAKDKIALRTCSQ